MPSTNENVKHKVFKQRGKIISQACDKCRQRKRKCDGVRPACSKCIQEQKGHLCVYSDRINKRGPKIHEKNSSDELNPKKKQKKEKLQKQIEINSNNNLNIPQPLVDPVSALVANQSDSLPELDFLNTNLSNIQEEDLFLDSLNEASQNISNSTSSSLDLMIAVKDESINTGVLLLQNQNTYNPIFDFSDIFLSSSIRQASFISEISSENGLKHFLNQSCPISPASEDTLQVAFRSSSENSTYLLQYIIFKKMFSTNLIALCPVEPIGILKHCPEDPDAKFQEEIFENILKNTQSYVIDVFIAYGCLRSKHPILFQPEFGGSPLCVGIYYLNKAIETLKILPANERYRIEALQSMFGVSCLLFYFGKKNDGLFWLTEVYKAAQHFNFDRPTAVLEDLDLFTVKTEEKVEPTEEEKEALIEKKQRRLLWARTMEILALVTSPLIGTEEEHFYMIDEQQWELIGVKRLVNSAYDVVDLTIEMQLCFLYRRSIRYVQAPIEETILQNDISKIHVALVSWHENIPKSMRTFDSLTDFIDGTRVFPECDWIDNAYNLSSNCWFLLALIKIHSHNNLFNPNQRFKFSENFPVDGTSLDFILVCFRALTSILLITLPKELELKLNSDERPFLYNIAVDILLTVTLHETIQIAVDCLKKGLGWALNLKLRQEVINLHLDRIYLKILKERNNPFSQSSYDMLIPIVETLKRDDINGIEISDGSVEGSINGSSTLGISEVFD